MKLRCLCLLFALAAAPAIAAEDAAPEAAPKVESFTLANGLKVVVIENHRIPAVSHMLWLRVGAADDPLGKSGLAHYHEHAMFLGTRRHPAGEYEAIVERNGGQQNAFTGHDATSYFINIYKSKLPLAMELEADRLRGIAPTEADMAKEKQVIIEERRERTDNNPDALLDEQMDAALFRNHPYHWPVIGWMSEMEGLTRQDVIEFHNRWYHPNNAVLIVSGDITARELRPLAERYYGNIPRGKLPARRWNAEPPQNNARRIIMHHANVRQPEWHRSYMAPSLGYGDAKQALPLMALSQLLGGGKTSKLYQSIVVDQKLASSIAAGYNGFSIGPSEFQISAVPEKDVSLEALEKAIDAELTKLSATSFSDDDFKAAKTQLKAEAVYARDGLSGMANIMGWLLMAGLSEDYFARWPSLVDAVTKEQVVAAAGAVFRPDQSVTAELLPAEAAKGDKP